MKTLAWSDDVETTVAGLRALAPPAAEVRAAVAAIVDDVRRRGDDAVRECSARFDGVRFRMFKAG